MALTAKSVLAPLARRWTRDPIEHGLLEARITHIRFAPRRYVLSHRLSYLRVPLTDLPRLARPFMRRNRFGLFSLHDRDYGYKDRDLTSWIKSAFDSARAEMPDGETVLVTLPRVAGFGFNPVSFWLCHDANGTLKAVLAEVNNTFGERHCYLARKPDGSAIGADDEIDAEKVFHVSPFMPVDGRYRFRFIEKPERLAIRVDLYREGRRALSATISGRLGPLTSASLARSFLRHPFPTMQVVLLIHYHAARLYLLGIKLFSKPAPPKHLVTEAAALATATIHSEPL